MQLPETAEFTSRDFSRIAALVYRHSGITLHEGKEVLVRSRLSRSLRESGAQSYEAFLDRVEGDASGQSLTQLIDLLTTNKTSFFREPAHFDYLSRQVLAELSGCDDGIRMWSAGCSTGEEPYTLSTLMHQHPDNRAARESRILATDISARVLERARAARYSKAALADVPVDLRQTYFEPVRTGSIQEYQIRDFIRSRVHFARLNLMDHWPMKRPFHVIFCRNVMIYFDRETQQRLVQRFWQALAPGGYLFVGHSEGLTSLKHRFTYVRPAVYRK